MQRTPKRRVSPIRIGSKADRKARAQLAVQRLGEAYPDAHTELIHDGPWQLLVATILSAQTTDVNVNGVTPALFHRYPTPAALAEADPGEVERIVQTTGFFRQKTKSIIGMSKALVRDHGGEVPPRMDDLVKLPGVGRKTANVVLGVAFGIPGLAVDTHVQRLSKRLGLTRQADPVKIESEVTAMIPPEEWSDFGLRLILHGRRVCFARKPNCPGCNMNDFCPSAATIPRPTHLSDRLKGGHTHRKEL